MRALKTLLFSVLLVACSSDRATSGECDPDNGGITLPDGFCARVFADEVGVARHIVVRENGDVFVALEDADHASAGTTKMRGDAGRGGVLALRDTTGDGRADLRVRFGEAGGSGIALRNDTLFFSTITAIYRYLIPAGALQPTAAETVAHGFPDTGGHDSHSIALGDSNALFMNMGSYGNVCNGADPCSQLDYRAGIWQFRADSSRQVLSDGKRYATGIRNAVGLAWNHKERALFATQHGRDGLEGFRQYFADRNVDDLPAEEFIRVSEGSDFGWPYCYYDTELQKKVLAPEYGGDGKTVGRCATRSAPLIGFPGHWAPDGLLFYTGAMFPDKYRDGAFVTFHGSWNRREQGGYNVAFVPAGTSISNATAYEVFANGFAGRRKSPSGARHRPVGLALAPDGSLYITDDQRGRIWNVRYTAAR